MAKTMTPSAEVPRAEELASALTLSRPALARLSPDMKPGAYLKALLQDRRWSDAIRFLAYALPPRKAVWWACLCAEHVVESGESAEWAAVRAAARWVVAPSAAHANDAVRIAQTLPSSSPGHALARAAEASGETPDAPPAAGKANPAGRLAAAAVLLAAAEEPNDLVHLYRQFLFIGLDVEADRISWEA